jgi:hypothetical protein
MKYNEHAEIIAGTQRDTEIAVNIRSTKLTTCSVAHDGSTVELELLDAAHAKVTLQLPLEHAAALAMTLPRLLTSAVRQSTGDQQARYVFDLGEWALESSEGRQSLLATLKTTDGFEVCFGIPFEACRSLGWNLQCGADAALDAAASDEAKSTGGTIPARPN